MSIRIRCASCGARCKCADTLAGRDLACPACRQLITVPARCPYCREEVSAAAKKCRHCGEILDPALRKADEAERRALRAEERASRRERDTHVVYRQPREFPHLTHLIMCFATCGAWLPIYLTHLLIDSFSRRD